MNTREIAGHPRNLYGIEVLPDLITAVTDAVLDEVAAWQARPLDGVIYFGEGWSEWRWMCPTLLRKPYPSDVGYEE